MRDYGCRLRGLTGRNRGVTAPTEQSTEQSPVNTPHRVFRGGSWINTTAVVVRAAYRDVVTPMYRYFNFGFRTAQRGCCQAPPPSQR